MWFWIFVVIFFVFQNGLYYLTFKKFSRAELVVSTLLTVLFYFLYQKYSLFIQLSLVFYFLALVWAGLKDYRDRFVMDYHLAVMLAGAVWARFYLDYSILITAIAVVTGFAVLFAAYFITKKKGIGMGDVLAFAIISITLDPAGVFAVLIISCLLGIAYGLVQILVFKKKEAIPMVPFIGMGLFLYLPFREIFHNVIFGMWF
jgi:hypothetical protein